MGLKSYKCPNCGSDVSESLKCSFCGSQLYLEEGNLKIELLANLCQSCGFENRSANNFCEKCGASLTVKCPFCQKAHLPSVVFCPLTGRNIREHFQLQQRLNPSVEKPKKKIPQVDVKKLLEETIISEKAENKS